MKDVFYTLVAALIIVSVAIGFVVGWFLLEFLKFLQFCFTNGGRC